MARPRVAICTLLAGLLSSFAAGTAEAKTSDEACFGAAVRGQEREKAGRLLDARSDFIECAKLECPSEVSSVCAAFARRVEEATPTVLVEVLNEAGEEVTGPATFIDGKPIPKALGVTRGVTVDPGSHEVRVEVGATRLTRKILVKEHEKGLRVTFRIEKKAPEAATTPSGSRSVALPLVFAGVGVVGLGVFGTFAGLGLARRSSAACDTGCSSDDASYVKTQFLVADVSLAVAAGALVTAAVLYLVGAGKTQHASGTGAFAF